jgi:hypothetical protein
MKTGIAFLLFFCLGIGSSEKALGAIVLSISQSSLANNSTNQFISLFGYSNTGAINNVLGMNLEVAISGPPGLKFMGPSAASGITYTGISSIWENPFPASTSGGIGNSTGGTTGVADFTFSNLTAVSGNILAPSLLARFNIDTTGVSNSSATLSIIAGANSFFLLDTAEQVSFSTSQPFQIGAAAAVPEPATTLLFAVGGVALTVRRLRRKTATLA